MTRDQQRCRSGAGRPECPLGDVGPGAGPRRPSRARPVRAAHRVVVPFPGAPAAGNGPTAGFGRGPEQRAAAARRAAERVDAAVRELAAVSRRLLPADGERSERWREQVWAAARRLVAERAAALTPPPQPPDRRYPGSAAGPATGAVTGPVTGATTVFGPGPTAGPGLGPTAGPGRGPAAGPGPGQRPFPAA